MSVGDGIMCLWAEGRDLSRVGGAGKVRKEGV